MRRRIAPALVQSSTWVPPAAEAAAARACRHLTQCVTKCFDTKMSISVDAGTIKEVQAGKVQRQPSTGKRGHDGLGRRSQQVGCMGRGRRDTAYGPLLRPARLPTVVWAAPGPWAPKPA